MLSAVLARPMDRQGLGSAVLRRDAGEALVSEDRTERLFSHLFWLGAPLAFAAGWLFG